MKNEQISQPQELGVQKGGEILVYRLQLDFFFSFPAEQPTQNKRSVYPFRCKKIIIICHEKVNMPWRETKLAKTACRPSFPLPRERHQ